jgi:hypothetical protein
VQSATAQWFLPTPWSVDAAKRLTNQHAVVSGEINGLEVRVHTVPAWSFIIARLTNANTSLNGRKGNPKFLSQQAQTCSAKLVRIRNVRPQL